MIVVIRGSLGKVVGRKLGVDVLEVQRKMFPDGEILIKIPKVHFENSVYIFQELKGSDSILELLFVCEELRRRNVKEINLVLPYLPYMRQDKEFTSGEIVSARIFPRIIEKFADSVITVNPHLHRIRDLREVFEIETKVLSAGEEIAEFIRKNFGEMDVVAPDDESKWIISGEVAKILGKNLIEFKKIRVDEKTVYLKLEKGKISENLAIVDDIASTGNTIAKCCEYLRRQGAVNVYCFVVHCLSEEAPKRVSKAGGTLYSTNTVDSPVSVIDVSEKIAKVIQESS